MLASHSSSGGTSARSPHCAGVRARFQPQPGRSPCHLGKNRARRTREVRQTGDAAEDRQAPAGSAARRVAMPAGRLKLRSSWVQWAVTGQWSGRPRGAGVRAPRLAAIPTGTLEAPARYSVARAKKLTRHRQAGTLAPLIEAPPTSPPQAPVRIHRKPVRTNWPLAQLVRRVSHALDVNCHALVTFFRINRTSHGAFAPRLRDGGLAYLVALGALISISSAFTP